MMRHKNSVLGLMCLFLFSTYANAEWESKLKTQLEQAELTRHQQFSFVQTRSTEDGLEVAVFEPESDPDWTLQSLNGEPPTDKAQKKFRKDRAKQQERQEEDRFADLIAPGSVRKVSSDGERVFLTFTPQLADMPEKAMAFMRGEAVLTALDERLLELKIYSVEPFSPAFSVKVDNMAMTFQFATELGQTLPKTYSFSFKGKAAGLKKFDVDSIVEYSEYQKVGG